ncbi:MAG: acyltransferase [Planctomycetes bacterium]|nr:acyltransferase [Planctomycetota bacterium]
MALLPPSSVKRIAHLDVLRGVAILLVVLAHVPFTIPSGRYGADVLFAVKNWCGTGIDLFFVLSGFLISGLLYREYDRWGTINYARFIWRRGLKIWPAYYAFFGLLLVINVLWPCLEGARPHYWLVKKTWASWVFLQNYAYNLWPHTWSLAVEEHFYIALPVVLWLLIRLHRKRERQHCFNSIPHIAALICLIAIIGRAVSYYMSSGTNVLYIYVVTHLRLDGLMFGVLLGYLWHYRREQVVGFVARRRIVAAVSVALVLSALVVPFESFIYTVFVYPALYVGFGGILVLTLCTAWSQCPAVMRRWAMPLTSSLRVMGIYSYTIYITHRCVLRVLPNMEAALRDMFAARGLGPVAIDVLVIAVYLVLGLGSGILLSHIVERPVLRWREKHFPSLTSSVPKVQGDGRENVRKGVRSESVRKGVRKIFQAGYNSS